MQTKNTLNLMLPITSTEIIYICMYVCMYHNFQVCTSNFSIFVCGTPNEQAVATARSVVECGIDASTGDVAVLSGRISCTQ